MLGGIKEQILGFNKWVLIGCALLVLATGGLVVWSNYFAKPSVSNAGVVAVDFANPTIDAHIEKAKVSNTMLYAQMKESWETLPKEKRLEILKMMYDGGATRGFNQVNLIDKDGKAIGFASSNRLEVPNL